MSAQELLEHTFLAVEPDLVLLATDANKVHLTLQVVFKGVDKHSVKFDFNTVRILGSALFLSSSKLLNGW